MSPSPRSTGPRSTGPRSTGPRSTGGGFEHLVLTRAGR